MRNSLIFLPSSLFDFTKHYRSEVSGGILKISYYPQLNPEKWNDVLAVDSIRGEKMKDTRASLTIISWRRLLEESDKTKANQQQDEEGIQNTSFSVNNK